MPLPGTSGSIHPTSLSLAGDSHHELPKLSCAEQCEGAAATPCPSSCNFLTALSLRDADPPWASSPYDMDQLIQLYHLPGDDDPSNLDQYLFPECSSWGTVAGTDHHRDGEHSYNPEKVPWSKYFLKWFYLFMFGCAGSLLLRGLFSSRRGREPLSSCGARASRAVASLAVEHRL